MDSEHKGRILLMILHLNLVPIDLSTLNEDFNGDDFAIFFVIFIMWISEMNVGVNLKSYGWN